MRTAGALKRTVRMHGRSHAESREIVEQKAKGRVRFSQLQCWFRRFREGPRLCPNSVDTPPPNNPTGKPIRPRDQLSQPASHQREAYQLSALSAGLAPLTGRLPTRSCKPTIRHGLAESVFRLIWIPTFGQPHLNYLQGACLLYTSPSPRDA